ncbi:MAG: S9 family peptidase [Candidatus Thorarchaeota archaeon]|jgi:oligopeptidase B
MTTPPVAPKKHREYEIHGVKIQDPFFWLREKDTPDVLEYLSAENKYAEEMMAHTQSLQEKLFEEMKNRIQETDESVPFKYGKHYYYYRTIEGKNYKIHCRKRESLDSPEEILLDENDLAADKKYMRLYSFKISPDERYLAYTLDYTGGEIYELQIKNLETGEVVDILPKVGYQVVWANDSKSVFYSLLDDIKREHAIAYHIVGTDSSNDTIIEEEPDKTVWISLKKSNDMSYLFLAIGNHTSEMTEIKYIDLRLPNLDVKMFFPRTEGIELDIEYNDGYFYLSTNMRDPKKFNLMRVSEGDIETENWELIDIPSMNVRRPGFFMFKDHVVLFQRKNGYGSYDVYCLSKETLHEIEMPEEIYDLHIIPELYTNTFYMKNSSFDTDTFRFRFSSPATPLSFYDYNMSNRVLELKKVQEIKNFDPNDYATKRMYARGDDGVDIPISIAYKKSALKSDEPKPLLLNGYGAYGASYDPGFNSNRISLLERGIIVGIAHIRGGGEKGKEWYLNGKLAMKKNTFKDFISCAKHLISERLTSSEKLCIVGGSAGGLLIGSVLNQSPNLFAAAVAQVPFVDIINTMLDDSIPVTTFEYKEWGNPNIKDEFDWMMKYSPYDNVAAMEYPPIYIPAGYNDPRVAYWEPAKWTAKLRSLKTDENPLILKMRMESGHGGSSGRYDLMREIATAFAFIIDQILEK